MLRRLVHLVVASTAVLAGMTVILRYFPDILPLASTEPQSIFETASLLTAAQWVALAVVVIASVSIVTWLWKSARARGP